MRTDSLVEVKRRHLGGLHRLTEQTESPDREHTPKLEIHQILPERDDIVFLSYMNNASRRVAGRKFYPKSWQVPSFLYILQKELHISFQVNRLNPSIGYWAPRQELE